MPNVINAFPLTIYQDTVVVEPQARDRMVEAILGVLPEATRQLQGYSWTGDVNGQEHLHNEEPFRPLFESFRDPIKRYLETLGLDPSRLKLYYTRSWGTVSRRREAIRPHNHAQAHLSLVYYLKKPQGSSGITFIDHDVRNEFAPNLFDETMVTAGVLKERQQANARQITIDVKEDAIVLFPSKITHAIAANRSSEPRISIAADIVTTVEPCVGLESVLPDLKTWRAID